MSKIIAVFNTKGGVGKTTMALNLGAYIAARGHRTLLVDLDPQRNLTSSLRTAGDGPEGNAKTPERKTVYELATENPIPKPFQLCRKVDRYLYLMAGSERVLDLEADLTRSADATWAAKRLTVLFAPYRLVFDYIIFDCPPHAGLIAGNALTAADYVIAPVMPTYYGLIGTDRLLRFINGVKNRLNPRLELLGLAVGRYRYTRAAAMIVAQLRSASEGKFRVFDTVIPETITVEEAHIQQLPLLDYNKSSKAAAAFEGLATEVLETIAARQDVRAAQTSVETEDSPRPSTLAVGA